MHLPPANQSLENHRHLELEFMHGEVEQAQPQHSVYSGGTYEKFKSVKELSKIIENFSDEVESSYAASITKEQSRLRKFNFNQKYLNDLDCDHYEDSK